MAEGSAMVAEGSAMVAEGSAMVAEGSAMVAEGFVATQESFSEASVNRAVVPASAAWRFASLTPHGVLAYDLGR